MEPTTIEAIDELVRRQRMKPRPDSPTVIEYEYGEPQPADVDGDPEPADVDDSHPAPFRLGTHWGGRRLGHPNPPDPES